MLIHDLVDPKASFDATNEPKDLATDDTRSDVNKAILTTRVRQYIESETILASNMNRIYVIIWA